MVIGMVTVMHFALTFVVALFIVSTLNIANQKTVNFQHINYIEIALTSAIFLLSVTVYFRSYKKMALFIENTFFRNTQ